MGSTPSVATILCVIYCMGKILRRVENPTGNGVDYVFFCPGCNMAHGLPVQGPRGWKFNNDVEKPTFEPSILVTTTAFTKEGQADYEKWSKEGFPNRSGVKFDSEPVRCHSYVRDGKIQFLDDCTHELKGQTIPLGEF